ncbi:MAG: ABC transporter ATP-binding protein [Spirochaetota bacterium]
MGVLYAFFGYVNRFLGPVREMSLVYNQLQGAAGALDRIGEYMEIDEELPAPESPRRPDDGWRGAVSARGVSFAYDEEEVLRDISFDAEAGSTTAVVGASGAGKTTLALLLARLYDPRNGRILLDATDERVESAARDSRAHEIIATLPHGYDTDVGEAGHLLSGGQRQLIALARVLVTDPRVLILDEPTAHVDVLTESLIQESMARLAGGRTTFIIAHRFSTLKHAERVLLVDEGELRGVGSHDELLESNETYRSLYEKQWAQTEAP